MDYFAFVNAVQGSKCSPAWLRLPSLPGALPRNDIWQDTEQEAAVLAKRQMLCLLLDELIESLWSSSRSRMHSSGRSSATTVTDLALECPSSLELQRQQTAVKP